MGSILDYIPTGSRNAITRDRLVRMTGRSDRSVRKMIEEARKTKVILNMQNGNGYFLPDITCEEDRLCLKQWVCQEKSRLGSIRQGITAAEALLERGGKE